MLKLNRYKQWIQALRRANLSPRQWLTLLTIPFTERRATRRTWRRRMSQCVRCPIFNKETKTCMLCDCYMPIKAAFAEQRCAGEIDDVASARGWDRSMVFRIAQNVGRRRGMSSLDVLTEAAIRRGRAAGIVINDQQKENDE